MSKFEAHEPICTNSEGELDLIIRSKETELGEFSVRRALPSYEKQMVGPFIFFDHMGPAEFQPGKGMAVRPHPHIGIATITYLFDGEIIHRDSLGFTQPIRPGAVNLMTAGRGIVHSERAGDDLDSVSQLHGIQSWIALPEDQEECDPEFIHYQQSEIPVFVHDDVRVSLIMGEAYGHLSPVKQYSPTLYLEYVMPGAAIIELPGGYEELAVYVVSGEISMGGCCLSPGSLGIPRQNIDIRIKATHESRVMLIGGNNIGPRKIWWNFVARTTERLEDAKQDWREGRFKDVPGECEFIPLPAD